MKDQQIIKLKELMNDYKKSQGEQREFAKVSLLAYLDGCLDSTS